MKYFSPDILVANELLKPLEGAGIGLKPQHYQEILQSLPALGWFEVHAENYMGDGGAPHHYLTEISKFYPLSIHGVGLSIGGVTPLDQAHLKRLQDLNNRYHPTLFSEHLAWSGHEGQFFNDLLPLPYTSETLETVCQHVMELQDCLGRQILLENPSTYITYADNSFSEPDFLSLIAARTECGLLLDVNNVFVSAHNNNFDAEGFIQALDLTAVQEIHLAGHAIEELVSEQGEEQSLLIDDHGSAVCHKVWQLYQRTLASVGSVPTLIERDNNIPSLELLLKEAAIAAEFLQENSQKGRGNNVS